MTPARMRRHTVSRLAVLAAVISLMTAAAARSDPAGTGQLRIDGQGITQVILKDGTGRQETLDHPGSVATLPPGEYSVQGITLQGGHYAISHLIPKTLCVTVDANACANLKMGAPLRQVVKVQRYGPVMKLGYELIGQGGEPYAIDRSQGPVTPAFTVYRGDKKVAWGQFEFG